MKRILLTLAALVTVACGADTDLETAFCEGLEAPAARSVNATSTPEGAADVTDDARVDIQLAPIGDQFAGFVTYRPDEAGRFAFGLSDDVGFVVRDQAGNEIAIDASVPSSMCEALAIRHTVQLGLGTYTIELGPTDVETIGIIAEESDDDL
jgi:hypothetical protein